MILDNCESTDCLMITFYVYYIPIAYVSIQLNRIYYLVMCWDRRKTVIKHHTNDVTKLEATICCIR